jgi:c-di-GMP-binding flagellar brake protein YcgR
VWDEVMAEKNRYEFRSTVLHRSKEEVAMLLAS